jgi:hypothetical protein
MTVLRNSNNDLRLAMTDMKAELTNLTAKVALLNVQVVKLESQNSEYTDLILRGLTQYFNDNPTIAMTTKSKLGTNTK